MKKTRWTGEETGRMLIFSLIDHFKRANAGLPAKPIVKPEVMLAMLRDLPQDEGWTYSRFFNLNNWLLKYYSVAVMHCERFKLYATRCLMALYGPLSAEQHRLVMEATLGPGKGRYDGVGAPLVACDGTLAVDEEAQAEYRSVMAECYYYALGYNRAIEMTAEYLKMPALLVLGMDLTELTERAAAVYSQAEELRGRINEGHMDAGLRQANLQALDRLFPPFDTGVFVIPEENAEKAKAMVEENLDAFVWSQDLIFMELLTKRG